jgi:type IV pilus assembly protein PilP
MSKLVKESMAVAGSYDAKGRFDPFEPLLKNDQGKSLTASKGRRRRIPQTPLERVAISQLKLSAIMRSNEGNSAIVEDATGKGYIIRKGTYIGLNSGQVTQIKRDSVMIEEEVEDVSGEFRMQNIELKLQKPAGEL